MSYVYEYDHGRLNPLLGLRDVDSWMIFAMFMKGLNGFIVIFMCCIVFGLMTCVEWMLLYLITIMMLVTSLGDGSREET